MDIHKKNRILKQIIAVLLLINIATITTILINRVKLSNLHTEGSTSITTVSENKHFFCYYLSLDDTQSIKLDSINAFYSRETGEVGLKMRDLKTKMTNQIIKDPLDTVALNKIYNDFLEMHVISNEKKYEYYQNIKSICNPIQAKKLTVFFNKSSEMKRSEKEEK
jgi:hypothetical protein